MRMKVGPTYDNIRKDLLICHQNRAWEVIKHSITIETAILAGWYYLLFEKDQTLLSILINVFAIATSLFLLRALKRYNELMNMADNAIKDGELTIYKPEDSGNKDKDEGRTEKKLKSLIGKNGTEITERLMIFLVIANITLLLIGITVGVGRIICL
ncbi:hypothetical protein [Halomonas caseinilytica]|uniref:hypothetical protein n=1 Tax=Halomonas caseinilytica TaxID=438744 RepID=UPI0007E5688F|nr:hypothetical protein [Halomonas caseinilytica]SEM67545.1 hypothetical protein SAMN04487952_10610 [Halomonas caseinilytica]